MKKINLEKIVYVLLLIIMIGLPILKFINYVPFIKRINPDFITPCRVYFLWASNIFLILTYSYSLISKERKKDIFDYLFIFLIITAYISTIFSIDFENSFFGEDGRYEGLLSLVCYYLLALNSRTIKDEKYKKGMINCFLYLGIAQSVYAILQTLTPVILFVRRFSLHYMAMGLCSNPNFFGSYMAMQLSIVTIYFIKEKKVKYLLMYILFTISFYLAGSTGPILGYVLAFILFAILLRKYYIRLIILALTFLVVTYNTDILLKHLHTNVYGNKINEKYVISSDIVATAKKIENKQIDKIGTNRILVWKKSLPLVSEFWLLGCGPDNFGKVYPQSGRIHYDKAHNVYLQIAITNGIFPLVAYMLICFLVFIKSFKLKKQHSLALFMAFVSYCILAFANISVVDVAPYFYIILGLLISEITNLKKVEKSQNINCKKI